MKKLIAQTLSGTIILALLLAASAATAQTTYTWTNSSGDSKWTTATNWSPTRTTPAVNDIILFNSGGTQNVAIRFSSAPEEIGQLIVSNNTQVGFGFVLASPVGSIYYYLNINGLAGDDLVVQAGSKISFYGNATTYGERQFTFLKTGATARIFGEMTFFVAGSSGGYTLDAADAGAIIFESGSLCPTGLSNVFTTAGTPNVAVFKDGSNLRIEQNGNIPFGLTAPASKIIFEPNSTIEVSQRGSAAGLSGRTVGNLNLGNVATFSSTTHTGNLPLKINNLAAGLNTQTFNFSAPITITGNVSVTSQIIFESSVPSEVRFEGTTNQVIGLNYLYGFGNIIFGNNVTAKFNNAAGFTINGNNGGGNSTCANPDGCINMVVKGIMDLTSGIVRVNAPARLVIGTNGTATNASATSFVDGKVTKKSGSVMFLFPVGKTNAGYAPFAQSNAGGDEATVEYQHSNPQFLSTNYPAGLHHVSQSGYWTMDLSAGPTYVTTLSGYWTPQISGNGSPAYINNLASLRMAHYDTTLKLWDYYGGVADGWSTPSHGSVTGLFNVSTGIWALASINSSNILANVAGGTLPVYINYLQGSKNATNNQLGWKITCVNVNGATMTLQKKNRHTFEDIYTTNATALRCLQPFDYTDANPAAGTNYYRLKITDANDKLTYSNTIAIINADEGFDVLNIYPSVVSTTATLNISTAQKTKLTVTVNGTDGKILQQHQLTAIAGSNQFVLQTAILPAGMYIVKITPAKGEGKTVKFVKR